MNIDTWCPTFPGLNETIYGELESSPRDIAKAYCSVVEKFIKEELGLESVAITFQRVTFPAREHEGIDIEMFISDEDLAKVVEGIKADQVKFAEYVKECFAPKPGFFPYYTNHYDYWIVLISRGNGFETAFALDWLIENHPKYESELF